MPGMDGWQVVERLRASPRTAQIPVVLETGAEDFPSFDRARKRGVAAFVSKPFRLGEVVELCRRVLEGARPLQGRAASEPDPPTIQVRDAHGNPLTGGRLLEKTAHGALVDLDEPLAIGQSVVVWTGSADGAVNAEVRWVTRVEGRYHHGLLHR
jgi:Response regulator receiver domain